MQTLQDLLHFIQSQERSIVFGNLGRYPNRLFEMLVSAPLLRVIIVSKNSAFSSTENRIRVQRPGDPIKQCDLLVYVEPATLQLVEKHPLASRVVVFTSHYTFQKPKGEEWINICYFHGMNAADTKAMIALQNFPIQTENVGLVEVDYANVLKISGRTMAAPKQADTFVIVDLTNFNKDVLTMYLAFWDAFDYLLEFKELIDRWVVCFSTNGRQAFVRFTQKVIDALFCRNFEHGNVNNYRDIVSLLPFYQSGIIDTPFEMKLATFGGMNFAVLNTVEEACKTAAIHNVIPVAKNVLWINEN